MREVCEGPKTVGLEVGCKSGRRLTVMTGLGMHGVLLVEACNFGLERTAIDPNGCADTYVWGLGMRVAKESLAVRAARGTGTGRLPRHTE